MNDEDFLRALESCELPEHEFGHVAHVRAAYLYLRGGDFADALERVRRSIRTLSWSAFWMPLESRQEQAGRSGSQIVNPAEPNVEAAVRFAEIQD